jgi:hypothetical protein
MRNYLARLMKTRKTAGKRIKAGAALDETFWYFSPDFPSFPQDENINPVTINRKKMLTIILLVAGAVCFWLFFKSIDFFEKI